MNDQIIALARPTWLKSYRVACLPFGCAGVLAAAMMFAQPAQGAVILLYDFDGQATSNGEAADGGQPVPSIVDAAFFSSATAITTPDNSDATGVRLQYRNSNAAFANLPGADAEFPTLEGRVNNNDTSGAPDPNKYFAFSALANSDFELATMSIDIAKGSNDSSPRGAQVLMSLDGFATAGIDLGTFPVTGSDTADVYEHFSFSLLGTTVLSGQTVDFRILPFRQSSGTGGVRFDNFTIHSVPEPASITLLCLSGLAIGYARGRRRK